MSELKNCMCGGEAEYIPIIINGPDLTLSEGIVQCKQCKFSSGETAMYHKAIARWSFYTQLCIESECGPMIGDLYNLVKDINPTEITKQIKNDNLSKWCNWWRTEAKKDLSKLSHQLQLANNAPCYQEEKDNPYPLCTGRGMAACVHCRLLTKYDPEEDDEAYANTPLTMGQLIKMTGEPVWTPHLNRWGIVDRWRDSENEDWRMVIGFSYGREWLTDVLRGGDVYRYKTEEEKANE